MTPALTAARRLVVKIGSSLLVDEKGNLRRAWLDALAGDLAWLQAQRVEAIVVSSGAIAVGRRVLGLARGPRNRALRLEESQAAAATGQIRLAHAWQSALARHHITVAQILLTPGDTEDRRRYLNARNTVDALLRLKVVPVINENDTVTTEEIRYGDNDRLAGRVAEMTSADVCVLLSDVDGLYGSDPAVDPAARHIPLVERITPDIRAIAGRPRTEEGTGGMVTKVEAARIATEAGCHLAIANGLALNPLRRLAGGGPCTWFVSRKEPRTARKRWIAGSLNIAGAVRVDAGAARALAAGKSLLPAGVTRVEGGFGRGDAVIIAGPGGEELARGLIAYSAADAQLIAGHRSSEIQRLLGYRGREEIIHRDDLVLVHCPTGLRRPTPPLRPPTGS